MAFLDLYYDLAVLLNDTATDNLTRCKDWINFTLSDLARMYQFEELVKVITTTADNYDFRKISPIKTTATLSFASTFSAEGTTANVYGYSLSGTTRTWQSESVPIVGTASVSTTNSYSVLDRIELITACEGNITVTSGTETISTMYVGESLATNNFNRIIKINAGSQDVIPITDRDRLLKYPSQTDYENYHYVNRGSRVYFYGVGDGVVKSMYVYINHPKLINDYDESPLFVPDPDIIEAARLGWGLRFEDEQDGLIGKQSYKAKLSEIVAMRSTPSDIVQMVKQARRR